MKKLGINIDWVLRDFGSQFDKHYRKVFINNPSHVDMTTEMTVSERTEEQWEELDKKIHLKEKELISLPVDSYNLANHYKFEGEKSLDGETFLTSKEAMDSFMYERFPFQVFGQAEEYENACDAFNRIQAYGLKNNLFETILISNTKSPSIPATFHFLSKNACRARKIEFIEDDYKKWDYCDVMIDCVPEVIQNIPEGKKVIKIEHPFNQWDVVEHSFKSIKDIKFELLDELFSDKKELKK